MFKQISLALLAVTVSPSFALGQDIGPAEEDVSGPPQNYSPFIERTVKIVASQRVFIGVTPTCIRCFQQMPE